MLVLDTDHLAEIERGSKIGAALTAKLEATTEDIATTIISAEEQLRGWLAQIRRQHDPRQQIQAYARLQRRFEFFAAWRVLPWTEDAASFYTQLRDRRIRIGTMDLKIAGIVLAHDATLLSRNLIHFRQVPDLRVEDWL